MNMSSTEIMRDLLKDYEKKYLTSKDIGYTVFKGYERLDATYMGICYCDCTCRICIQKIMDGHNYWSKVILWHEFCHAWAWHEDAYAGHGWAFLKRAVRKPILFVAQVPCCFFYLFLRLINSIIKKK